MAERLSAHFENREYFFTFLSRRAADRSAGTPDEVQIDMYGTIYYFVKLDGKWVNRAGNKMNMAQGLIEAVIRTLHEAGQ